MNESLLKNQLILIKNNNYRLPEGASINDIVGLMLNHIGSLDSELRDDLIYRTFCEWILHDRLSCDEIAKILDICLDNDHLKYRLLEDCEDAVFTRTFSVLVIAVVLEYDNEHSILDGKRIQKIFKELCSYYALEKNVTGYYLGKGWAHSVAHSADAFSVLVDNKHISNKEIYEILELIKNKFQNYEYSFVNGEDERTADIIAKAIKNKQVSETRIAEWLKRFADYNRHDKYPDEHIVKGNIRNLLRSVYFKTDENNVSVRKMIENLLRNLAFS